MWCSIISSISFCLLRNEQKTWTELSSEIFICHVMFDNLINLTFSSSKWAEGVNRTIFRNLHFSCDVWPYDQSRFLFFEISRIGELKHLQKSWFVMWCSLLWSIWLFRLRNYQNTWSQLCWEIFVCHVIFHHLINLAFAFSKFAEYVHRTIFRNLHFSCDVRSSHQSHFLFEISRAGEQNYFQKCLFFIWCSILWSIWLCRLRNNQNTWSKLYWEIFFCHMIFRHLINLAFCSSKLAE
jgi:hypothetical protein